MLTRLLNNLRGARHFLHKGLRLIEEQRFALAVRPLTRAKEIAFRQNSDDNTFISHIYLTRGKAYLGYGQILLAKSDLEKAIRLNPEDQEIEILLAPLR